MIHDSLKKYLERHRVTERDIARELGISPSYLSMLKRGQRRPSIKLARKIETITGIPFHRLLLPDESIKIR